MNETECLSKMIAPGMKRPGKLGGFGGVIQVLVTSACDKACYNCTQASNIKRPLWSMTLDQFEQALLSLKGYFGVVGLFGGNPAISKYFAGYCELMRKHVPYEQRGLWCNNPITVDNAKEMRATFNPGVCNLNVHMDRNAFNLFKTYWPESGPFGLEKDSRHSPPWVAMKDVIADEGKRWELISGCDINQHWSAGLGIFRGQLRGWFCELAMAQSILHQDDPEYPDTGVIIFKDGSGCVTSDAPAKGCEAHPIPWWQLPMSSFQGQVRKHCHDCGIPLRGHGELAQATDKEGKEQVSATHVGVYKPKRVGRTVERVTELTQLETGKIQRATDYMGNAKR